LLFVAGLALAALGSLLAVVLWAVPALPIAAAALAGISWWVNRRLTPPDARFPGPGDPWTCQEIAFVDHGVETPGLFLRPAQPNGATVCWVHGTGDGKAHYKWTILRALTRRGFSVLTFDLPGHDEHPVAFALPAALTAVPAALAYLGARPDVDPQRVGLLGVSLGGALAIHALADDPRPEVQPAALCLLETPIWLPAIDRRLYAREAWGVAALQTLEMLRDCSLGNLWRLYRTHPGSRFAQPLEWVFDDLCPARRIARIPPVPLLLVYGGRDPIAPAAHGRRLFDRARGDKTWKLVRHASHLSLIFMSEAAECVGDWFAKQLGERSLSSFSPERGEEETA
jgi:alpha-beta hydrolase superfamily lysophospholipase